MPQSRENTRRHALITGASRGIGAGIAVALASAGCAVTINYRRDRNAAESVAASIRSTGGQAAVAGADVSDIEGIPRLLAQAREAFGSIHILVNNAGIGEHRSVFDNTLEDFDKTFQVNVRSAFALTQAVIPEMREQRFGRLIFLSSMAAVNGGIVSTPYASSKAALLGMMRSYAAALIDLRITSNAIAPALVESDMISSMPTPAPETMPLGRLGRPSEVGDVARLLVACEYLNEQTIHLNAGRHMT